MRWKLNYWAWPGREATITIRLEHAAGDDRSNDQGPPALDRCGRGSATLLVDGQDPQALTSTKRVCMTCATSGGFSLTQGRRSEDDKGHGD